MVRVWNPRDHALMIRMELIQFGAYCKQTVKPRIENAEIFQSSDETITDMAYVPLNEYLRLQ